jgi:hypothetical protein
MPGRHAGVADLVRELWVPYRGKTSDEVEDRRRASLLAFWAEQYGGLLKGRGEGGQSQSQKLADAAMQSLLALQSADGGERDDAVGRLLTLLDSVMEYVSLQSSAPGWCDGHTPTLTTEQESPGGVGASGKGVRSDSIRQEQAAQVQGLAEVLARLGAHHEQLLLRVSSAEMDEIETALSSEDEAGDQEGRDCVVCLSYEAVVALRPCGHVCLCQHCSALSTCPMSVTISSVISDADCEGDGGRTQFHAARKLDWSVHDSFLGSSESGVCRCRSPVSSTLCVYFSPCEAVLG